MKHKRLSSNASGFTLIEIIGVLAVIAILVALVAPKIFQTIAESKTTRMAAEVNTYSIAVVNWYKDVGTLQSLTAAGVANGTDTTFHDELIAASATPLLLWTRWQGPYIDSVANIAIGTALAVQTNAGAAGTAAPGDNATSFDLNDDNANDMAGQQVVAIVITGASATDFARLDAAIDSGLTNSNSGKIKLDSGNGNIYIWLASN